MKKEEKELYAGISSIVRDNFDGKITQKKGCITHFPVFMSEVMKNTDIEALHLSQRSYNCLKRVGIFTVGNFCEVIHTSSELGKIRNCGKTCIAEIMDALFTYQYDILDAQGKERFIIKLLEMNG